jgi:short-subunit dehydrogenase
MENRTVFVTGASSGIGAALSRRLARAGHTVVLSARRADALDALAGEIRRAGGVAHVYPLDVCDPAGTRAVIRRADDALGGLDVVVANAGIDVHGWSGKLRHEDVQPTIDVNVTGAVATLLAVMDRMVERRRGHLVGLSSLAQYRGLPKQAAYCASKAFLSTFLEGLRIDLRSVGIAVTDVRPGFVRTPMTEKNSHAMPFMVGADEAADAIARGIEARDALVTFPWQLTALARVGLVVPDALYDRTVARARG